MAYASQDEIQISAGGEERLKQIADQDGDGVVDAAVIARAQRDADAHINRHTKKKFASLIGTDALPLDTAIELAADECVYRLRKYIGQLSDEDRKDFDIRLAELVKLAGGETVPDDPPPAASTVPQSVWIAIDDEDDPTDGAF